MTEELAHTERAVDTTVVTLEKLRKLVRDLKAGIQRTRALRERLGLGTEDYAPVPAPTLDGLVCARCDAFGHDAPDCPTGPLSGSPATAAAPTSSQHTRKR